MDLRGLGGPRSWMMEIQLTPGPQTVIGAVEAETTETGRTKWTVGLAEKGVETAETGRWPGGDHSVNRARWSSQELVEPGGDHRRGTTRKWIT